MTVSLHAHYQQLFIKTYLSADSALHPIPKFISFEYGGDFGVSRLTIEALRGRIKQYTRYRNWSFLACMTAGITAQLLFEHVGFSSIIQIACVSSFFSFHYPLEKMKKIEQLNTLLVKADAAVEAKAIGLLLAGRKALQECWKVGLPNREILLFVKETINAIGKDWDNRQVFQTEKGLLEAKFSSEYFV